MRNLRMCKQPRDFSPLHLCAVVLALLPVMGLQGCKAKATGAVVAQQTNPNEVSVTPALAERLKFGRPEMRDVMGKLQVAAHVDTDARLIAHVGSPVSGRIIKLLVFEGQSVKAGAVLAMLHSTELSDAQVALIKATSQQNLAATSVKRAEQLVEADVIGRAELERRRAELLQASTEAASYRTQLRGLGMTEEQIRQVETNRKLSADYPIVTPKSGTVLKRDITIGQVVQPADPAFTIADLSTVWIVANVPEEDAGQLDKGMAVSVRIPAIPEANITGHLSFVSPIVDPATRTVEVRMDLDNKQGFLKPDQLASMTFVGHANRKLTVPNTAVVRDGNSDYVFVQTGPTRYVLREVALGEEENDHRVVLSGVQENEQIVTEGAFHLNNQRKQNAIKGGE
jgi:membrane fusion protein, heavy metal efflux system